MLKVNFFHVCEKVIVEQGTGNVSVIGIFENINSQNFPAVHPQMTLVAGFEADKKGSYEIELILLDEEGEILKTQNKILIGDNLKGNWFNRIVMYKIPREKTQKIKLNYQGQTIYTGYLTINNK